MAKAAALRTRGPDYVPPYWATPQCILKRHLLAADPNMGMVDCTRREGQPVLMRLIRPGVGMLGR